MKFLNKKMLLVINRMSIDLAGGSTNTVSNVRPGMNLGFVEQIFHNTVFGQPLYPDIYHQAAAYMFHIIKNHAFIDGNKRTGLAAAITFLGINGHVFAPLDEDSVFNFVIEIAAGPNDPDQIIAKIADWLKSLCLS
jgi:death-on-curing protein